MDKIVPILMLLVVIFIAPARAGGLGQILGDIVERVGRAFNVGWSATRGENNCGDEVQYKDSEWNAWNFRGWHAYYPCCHGYERYEEYDVDCDKPVCDGWKACGDRGSCVEPGRCSCHTGYTGKYDGCRDYACTGAHDCGRRGTCIGPNLCKCKDGYRGSEEGCKTDINECLTGPCDQSCTNTVGSFKCSCYPGFEMKDGRCVKQHVDYDSLPEDTVTFPGFKPNIPSHNPKPALATWAICLIVGGILLFLCILLGMCFCCCHSRSNHYHNV